MKKNKKLCFIFPLRYVQSSLFGSFTGLLMFSSQLHIDGVVDGHLRQERLLSTFPFHWLCDFYKMLWRAAEAIFLGGFQVENGSSENMEKLQKDLEEDKDTIRAVVIALLITLLGYRLGHGFCELDILTKPSTGVVSRSV
ncbi:hypothetical protein Nepgr_002139 [Nepenthes gracilis]|uniref:Uncharacterized protein n=1 Tax=Nepenthes gracilis TaxID=150966 RepID=A0AAD3P3G1_NEPGR|nr:hypothetical protein Nepgr_002139 [Nepenthes gracilis]